MKNKYLLIAAFMGISFLWSCKEDTLDLVNPNALTTDLYYTNLAQLQAGANSMYTQARGLGLVALNYFWLDELTSDDAASGGGQCPIDYVKILNNSQDASNPIIGQVWECWYRLIHRANVVIQKAPGIKLNPQNLESEELTRKNIVGQAKFFRAWAYYELALNFGKVPVYTTPVSSISDFKVRAELDVVYAQIEKDLNEAIPDLANAAEFEGGKVTKYAAIALLGKTYMLIGDYAKAKTQFTKITSSGLFSLSGNYMENFLEEYPINNESIFQINFLDPTSDVWSWGWSEDGNETYALRSGRNQWIDPLSWRNMIPSDNLLAEYESTTKGFAKTDPRLKFTVYFEGDPYNEKGDLVGDMNGNTSNYEGQTVKTGWKKSTSIYNAESWEIGWHASQINQRIIRYSDVLLLLAECENETGNSTAAMSLVNQIRDRESVAMPHYPIPGYTDISSKNGVFNIIMHERRVELAFEEVRSNDIKRWKRQGKINEWPFSYSPKNPDMYMPIPITEVNGNPLIGQENQNEGY